MYGIHQSTSTPTILRPMVPPTPNQISHGSTFLSGFLSIQLVSLQQEYYSLIGSKKLGNCWDVNLAKKLQDITHQLWENRCEVLHVTETIYSISGVDTLKSNITSDYHLRYQDLPAVFSPYLYIPTKLLLLKSTGYFKQLFLTILSGQKASASPSSQDNFYQSPTQVMNWTTLPSYPTYLPINIIVSILSLISNHLLPPSTLPQSSIL